MRDANRGALCIKILCAAPSLTCNAVLLVAALLLLYFSPSADILVDPFFLDAFQQQPSTPTYDALLASLPRAFVGTAPELKQMVALLTAQSIKAYNVNVSWRHSVWLGLQAAQC